MNRQQTMIKNYLLTGAPLTGLEAIDRFGVYALSQRVGELKRMGNEIRTERIELESGKRVAQYWMVRPAEQMGMNL